MMSSLASNKTRNNGKKSWNGVTQGMDLRERTYKAYEPTKKK